MLNATDLTGLYAIIPTPAKADAARLDARDTVDLDESARLVDALIADGVSGLIALGTTGECATLSRSDYEAFADCVLQTVDRRIPTFIGASALGGHEVASRMAFIRERGADGTLLGLPMWQPVNTEMAVGFYKDVSAAFPDVAVMVYANARAFRYSFPPEFWQAVARAAPTVIAAKFSRPKNLNELIKGTGGRIHFMPNEMTVHEFYAQAPATTTACWATAAGMGPSPAIALMNAILANDAAEVERIARELGWANEPLTPIIESPEIFASFNIQVEKTRINEAGYCRCGPIRPPYAHMPAEYEAAARECGRRWATLREKYPAARSSRKAAYG
ncbi:MAG: trans-o-hydroxybenzylidenepyruvate hydratase-aldolase [Alphaproteobacteria bacterium]|jgi:dihydrodipicolinate synthase/N-acetylneuraminate lyase|nr:trans-o-hydroxybenzylidenepyruvate hydratase-aldolase [Alphaproteobacteria bacterium]